MAPFDPIQVWFGRTVENGNASSKDTDMTVEAEEHTQAQKRAQAEDTEGEQPSESPNFRPTFQNKDLADHTDSIPPLQPPSPPPHPASYIKATPFSTHYKSRYTLNAPTDNQIQNFAHFPCSYVSTPGIAPSLLQLKQHAHDLIVLIKTISCSSNPAIVDCLTHFDGVEVHQKLKKAIKFLEGESFDFLNDLNNPYTGPTNEALQRAHNLPLTALLNILEEKHIPVTAGKEKDSRPRLQVRDICPLHTATRPEGFEHYETPINAQALPYATHETLIKHANEILELLDHQYSAKGGLLAILPEKENKEQREAAESTLLGQMILYIQRLVQRLHDLECQYANSMDVLAGEAAVPHQHLSRLGPSNRSGREMVYPQDRFVLVNAGEDVWSYLDEEFTKKERADELVMQQYRNLGVTGEKLWESDGKEEMVRGITAIDINTRYYRLRNDKLKTIFVIPAYQAHPGVKVTRDMEAVPTVVSVVKPVWPERSSLWEQKHRAELEDGKRWRDEAASLRSRKERLEQANTVLDYQLQIKDAEVRELKKKLAAAQRLKDANTTDEVYKLKAEVFQGITNNLNAEMDIKERKSKVDTALATAEADKESAAKDRLLMASERTSQTVRFERKMQDLQNNYDARVEALIEKDADNGRAVVELDERVKKRWLKQIKDTQDILEELRFQKEDIAEGEVREEAAERARIKAERISLKLGLGSGSQPLGKKNINDDSDEDTDSLSSDFEIPTDSDAF